MYSPTYKGRANKIAYALFEILYHAILNFKPYNQETMSNIVLKLCRETKGYTHARIAKAVGVTVKKYTEMEDGELLMNREQSEKLGKLYKMKSDYFYTAALQLDSLLVRKEVIRILKWKNEQLESQLKRRPKSPSTKRRAKPKTSTPA